MRFRATSSFASDYSCSSTLMAYGADDASGHFVARFYSDANGNAPWTVQDGTNVSSFYPSLLIFLFAILRYSSQKAIYDLDT